MHLATVQFPNGERTAAVSADGNGWLPLNVPDLNVANISELLSMSDGIREAMDALANSIPSQLINTAELRMLNPLPSPRKILCCGLNYLDHIAETGRSTPEFPTLFAKFADTLTGPTDDIHTHSSERLDWEAELVVVIGAPVYRATKTQAQAAIFGYTVANDLSMRDWQQRTLQWLQGKAFDGTTPIGPAIVTADSIDPKAGLRIEGLVNGQSVQLSSTSELAFDSADLVAYVSQFTALQPGDLILTGTPGGVGMAATPPRYLTDGDLLTTRIEGIGELSNRIRVEASTPQTSAQTGARVPATAG